MAFRDFGFPQVRDALGLTIDDADLFASAADQPVRDDFAAFLRDGVALAVANSTEKARSEFIIAPILLELRRMLGNRFALFSGLEWDVDASRGLNGYCDYLITRGPSQHVMGPPYVAIVEAKNDVLRSGFGQCIAAMVAAQVSNQRAGVERDAVHGIVSTGSAWKFLRLRGEAVTIDVTEYYIDNLPKVMGVLRAVVEGG